MLKIDIATPFGKGGLYFWGNGLAMSLNRMGYDAHHIHDARNVLKSYFSHDVLHTALPILGRKVILTVHGDYRREENVWRHFWKPAIKSAEVVSVPSHFLRRTLDIDALVIPNGIFTEKYSMACHQKKDTLLLFTATNLDFSEKASGVVKILDILKNVGGHFIFRIAGDGKYSDVVKGRIGGGKNTEFLGYRRDVSYLLSTSDIFLYYSFFDNLPSSLLEAMASGLPVVTNRVGAVEEVIENGRNGFIASNDEEYAYYVNLLICDHEKRKSIGENAREAAKRFDWRVVTPRFLKIYEDFGL